ncbi:MAG: alpha/beta hydrolase family protein [Massilia sp.]
MVAETAAPIARITAPGPLDIEKLLRPRGFVHLRLSPDGKRLAGIFNDGLSQSLVTADVETLHFKAIVSPQWTRVLYHQFLKMPLDVFWISNDLLAVDTNDNVMSVDLEGKFVARLGQRYIGKVHDEDASATTVLAYPDDDDNTEITQFDARTGKRTTFSFPMSGRPIKIAFDSRGEPRAVTMVDSSFWKKVNKVVNWYKPPGKAAWKVLQETKVSEDYWSPMFVPDEAHSLIVSSRQGRDTRAIFSLDTDTLAMGEMLAGHPSLDITGADGLDQQSFLRVWTSGLIPQEVWLDGKWAAAQRNIDLALPKRVNRLSGNRDSLILVHSFSDVDPGRYYLYDVIKATLNEVASTSAIKPSEMHRMEIMQYASSDGLMIPGFLTRPVEGGRKLPLVVMIHGGPTERDYWGFDADVQILAARGYAVFQPQFRGSSGFGRKFEEAGKGQWGLAMQDDVTAGVEHLIKEGIADPKRICIYGASYGGYAALWGLVKTPELYRCGVSFAGPTDLTLMFHDYSDRVLSSVASEYQRFMMGDADANRQQFDAVSPLKQAARIQVPVLLVHGEYDIRVPPVHSTKMHKALKDAGKDVELVTLYGVAHGFRYSSHELKFQQTLLAFLQKHLGEPAAPAPVQAP